MRIPGGWLPFGHEDKPWIPGQESDKIFTKEGMITVAVIVAVLIAGGIIYSHFFGPYSL